MVSHLDNLLRQLFIARVRGIGNESQVRFRPPDQDWRQYVTNLAVMTLNVYLVDLRENRALRSNERVREIKDGVAIDTPVPLRMDCHYLITAWSPAVESPAVEPSLDEHRLLYDVTAALMKFTPLVAREIYAPNPLPGGFPELIADAELPTMVLPVEGFPKYAEFWGTMGQIHPWKPAIYLVVTLPVAQLEEVAGPMVTTRISEFRLSGHPETEEIWIEIGGQVLDTTNLLPSGAPTPIVGASVELLNIAGARLQLTYTNDLGRFSFAGLKPVNYQLRYSAVNLGVATRSIMIPSPSGEYDLLF